jgi:Domain of unknown function (DUF4397)
MVRKMMAVCFGLGMLAVLAAPGVAGAAANDGTVYVVHGIPGVPVDVYVNGAKQLPNFEPGKVAGPLTLPAGDYQIKIFKAGDPETGTPVIDTSVTLPAGANASLVAHLDASGKPVLTTFVNDTAAAPAGQGRLVVRHTAAAPAVDVLANGKAAFTNLVNPKEAQADLPAGTISASVVATGTTTPVLIGPADVPVEAGMATIVYAVGAPASGSNASTLGVVTQQIPLAGSAMSVQTGTGGLLAGDGGVPTAAIAGIGVALAALVTSLVALRRHRATV